MFWSNSGVQHLSFSTTRNERLWKISLFLPRSLENVYKHTGDPPAKRLGNKDGPPRHANRHSGPGYTVSRLFPVAPLHQDGLLVVFRAVDPHLLVGSRLQRFLKFKKLIPDSNKFSPDPYVICRYNEYYVFIEEGSRDTGRGHISVINMKDDGRYEDPIAIMQRRYHLSYSFVLEWRGEICIILESANNRTIEAYRCIDFPDSWK